MHAGSLQDYINIVIIIGLLLEVEPYTAVGICSHAYHHKILACQSIEILIVFIFLWHLEKRLLKAINPTILHIISVGQLTKKMNDREMEKEELEQELEKVKKKLQDIKHKYDQMLLDTEGHMPVHDHITMVADLKR